jgi:plasmid stability protein
MQMKPMLLRLPIDVHRRLKILAAEHDVSMKAFLIGKILEGEKKAHVGGALAPAESTAVESTLLGMS